MGKDLQGNTLPSGIMQRKSGIYRGRFYYKGETYTKDNADLKKLVQEMEDLRYEVKHGIKGKGDNVTLNAWFDVWLNTHKKRSIKESTQVRYDDFYRRYIEKQIGKYRVTDFTPILIEHLLQNMADKDFSTKTIRDVYNILNAMFKYAVHNRIITFNPCAGVDIPKTKKKDIRVLTVEEQREVVEHAKGRMHENMILDALGTGLRSGELRGLTWEDINFQKREISINKTLVYIKDIETKKYVFKYQTPKTKNSMRTIPMQESVYKAMKNASQIKEKKYIKTWLWRIVINTAVDATRRQSRFVSDDQVQEEGQEDRYEDTDIMAALDTLEEKERKVIMLKVFEEWTIREIADCLHENPNTVKSMLYRGLKKLRGKVEAEMV